MVNLGLIPDEVPERVRERVHEIDLLNIAETFFELLGAAFNLLIELLVLL